MHDKYEKDKWKIYASNDWLKKASRIEKFHCHLNDLRNMQGLERVGGGGEGGQGVPPTQAQLNQQQDQQVYQEHTQDYGE